MPNCALTPSFAHAHFLPIPMASRPFRRPRMLPVELRPTQNTLPSRFQSIELRCNYFELCQPTFPPQEKA